jgi:hypothetical protein
MMNNIDSKIVQLKVIEGLMRKSNYMFNFENDF